MVQLFNMFYVIPFAWIYPPALAVPANFLWLLLYHDFVLIYFFIVLCNSMDYTPYIFDSWLCLISDFLNYQLKSI